MAGKTGAEADKAEGFEIVDGVYTVDGGLLGVHIPTGPVVINRVPDLGLTVFGATIEHVEGESRCDTRRRLAEALLRLGSVRIEGLEENLLGRGHA